MSTEKPSLWSALLRARQAIARIPKTATNPHFGNAYTPLEDILSAVLPAFRAEGLVLCALGGSDERGDYLAVRAVLAETGEFVESRVRLVGATDMQKLGGAFTYANRYGIAALAELEMEGTDDDGNTASRPQAPARPQGSPTRPSQPQASPRAQGSAPPASTGGFKPTKPVDCPACGRIAVFPSSKVPGGMYCANSAKYGGCGKNWTADEWESDALFGA